MIVETENRYRLLQQMTPIELLKQAEKGDRKSLSRLISLVENQCEGYMDALKLASINGSATVIGITGPPGAGKSTLTDALIGKFVNENKRVAVLCIDPSSPFSMGALLGDRIRMQAWYDKPNVFIRSLATRGHLGGMGGMTFEITDILKGVGFDVIIIETVGVGQSEVDIAAMADIVNVVLVPESGDDVQTMKSGLMEIADVFVINKSDRPGAALLKQNLIASMHMLPADKQRPVVETTAVNGIGIEDWVNIMNQYKASVFSEKKLILLAEKVWNLICNARMTDVDKEKIMQELKHNDKTANLYQFVELFLNSNESL